MTEEEYEHFLHAAVHELTKLNSDCTEQFSIGQWEHWDYDLDAATLTFSESGKERVIADVQVVGSTSVRSNSWLWGWANENLPRPSTALIEQVRVFGQSESLRILTEPSWPDDEYHGWELTAIAAKLINGRGGYRTPRDAGGFLYFVYTAIRFAGDRKMPN